ncbi:hypothetical protein HDV05_007371 [Chytridiales sp. JEL 0842]|nr:hypothetical protein HDV05_007371 [Chytridiales sp. JEL 0842]
MRRRGSVQLPLPHNVAAVPAQQQGGLGSKAGLPMFPAERRHSLGAEPFMSLPHLKRKESPLLNPIHTLANAAVSMSSSSEPMDHDAAAPPAKRRGSITELTIHPLPPGPVIVEGGVQGNGAPAMFNPSRRSSLLHIISEEHQQHQIQQNQQHIQQPNVPHPSHGPVYPVASPTPYYATAPPAHGHPIYTPPYTPPSHMAQPRPPTCYVTVNPPPQFTHNTSPAQQPASTPPQAPPPPPPSLSTVPASTLEKNADAVSGAYYASPATRRHSVTSGLSSRRGSLEAPSVVATAKVVVEGGNGVKAAAWSSKRRERRRREAAAQSLQEEEQEGGRMDNVDTCVTRGNFNNSNNNNGSTSSPSSPSSSANDDENDNDNDNDNAPTSKSTVSTFLKNGATPYARTPELRVSHKLAERKRRKEMKDLFEELKEALPERYFKTSKASKWEVLSKAIDHIDLLTDLAEEMGGVVEERDRLRREVEVLRREKKGEA